VLIGHVDWAQLTFEIAESDISLYLSLSLPNRAFSMGCCYLALKSLLCSESLQAVDLQSLKGHCMDEGECSPAGTEHSVMPVGGK